MIVGQNDYPDETVTDAQIVERLDETRLRTVRNGMPDPPETPAERQYRMWRAYEAVDDMVEEIFAVLALREKKKVGDLWP